MDRFREAILVAAFALLASPAFPSASSHVGDGDMTSAGHHTMMLGSAPSAFPYVGIKFAATRLMRNYSSLSAYNAQGSYAPGIQASEIQFKAASGTIYTWPSDMRQMALHKYNDIKAYQDWLSTASQKVDELSGRLFDISLTSKMFIYGSQGLIRDPTTRRDMSLLGYGTGAVLIESTASVDGYDNATVYAQYFGVKNNVFFSPAVLVLDLSSSPLNTAVYNKWCFYNANDNASQGARTWVEGEILGSADLRKWWRLDVFNDTSIPNTNYEMAYTGDLVPRKGDVWGGIDVATRDWTVGISTAD